MKWLSVLVLVSLTTLGCGDGRPKCVPVSGQVLIDGKPVAHGFVRVVPKGARPATGELDAEGRFTLMTFETGDGVVEGTHPVAVTAFEQLGPSSQRWHAPKKYADPDTSGKTITVDGPNNSVVIELSWEGGKPFVERTSGGE